MKLSEKRLVELLKHDGFELVSFDKTTKDIHFVRNSKMDQLFEHLFVCGQGKWGEVVYAFSTVSAVRLFSDKGIVSEEDDNELLYELETDKERHWTELNSLVETKAWEQQLAKVAAIFTARNAENKGPKLLARLDRYFDDVQKYLCLAGDINSIFEREYQWTMEFNENIRNAAERVADNSFLRHAAYDDVLLACLILFKYGDSVEGKSTPWQGVMPLDSKNNLYPKILLIADHLVSKRLEFNKRN